ncbi:E3 ubiquitin-protein ligase ATL42-like [Gossypium arboreum]|uniref:RING-type E3 ubiquitin transferase n=1 Tax=Gossypium arboreum TaxID=29729 RepID=A0ABR0MJ13_GOSAR|nr:E3 ubiquitin-protein ligase ATL42-like [Gossypium arboreum]KAK5773229.1 hypothetical protein PVK06_049534 [Gossypium arboreum]
MNRLNLTSSLFLLFVLLVGDVESTSNSHGDASSDDAVSNFQPSLAIVIGILCAMFALTLSLVACTKFCHRGTTVDSGDNLPTALRRTKSGFSGIDKKIIESLPFFKFSSIKGSKQGLECSVCLSKFEDTEVLRLLPQCKHAFHVECIDEWLEKHSSCPLCRQKINADDPTILTYSNSFRFLRNGSNSNMELKEDGGSSRFETRTADMATDNDDDWRVFHKLNVVFKNRWSNLSSSDIVLLNSEMINDMSNDMIENEKKMKIIEDVKIKISSINETNTVSGPVVASTSSSRIVNEGERRSMSDITVLSRFRDVITRNRTCEPPPPSRSSSLSENFTNEETIRRQWWSIARRTIQWFSNREIRSQKSRIQPI